jgi:hypothetical protein
MRIGTSLGKCLKDILDGTVKEDDVLVIVSNTKCPDLPRLMAVVDEYYYSRPHSDYDLTAHTIEDAQALAQRLFESGKLHQPRCLQTDTLSRGGNAHNLKDTWLEVVPTITSHNQSVVDAYGKYRMLAVLAS